MNKVWIGFDVGIDLASEDGDLTIEIIKKDNSARALLGINYKGDVPLWYSLISKEYLGQPTPSTDITEALAVIANFLGIEQEKS